VSNAQVASLLVDLKGLLAESKGIDRKVIRARAVWDTRAIEALTQDKAVVEDRVQALASLLRLSMTEQEIAHRLYGGAV